MPPVAAIISPIIAGIASAAPEIALGSLAVTGIGLGEQLANQPSAPKAPVQSPADIAKTADATKQNQLAALSQQTPNIQAATGGSLSPDAWAQLAAILSGQAGNPGIGSSQQDLVQKLLTGSTGGGTVTAGNNTGGGTPGTTGGLTNTTFG